VNNSFTNQKISIAKPKFLRFRIMVGLFIIFSFLLTGSIFPENKFKPQGQTDLPDFILSKKISVLLTQTNIKDSQGNGDSDNDGLSNDLEYQIATTYAPMLVFDEGEKENVFNTLVPLYQVTPLVHHSGQKGAMLVFTFLYDNDYGADFDQGWKDWLTDPLNTACSAAGDPFDQYFGQHCGDSESIYFFIAETNNWQSYSLYSIYWKRHYDPIYETGQDSVEYSDFGSGGNRTHPILYVSANKHGMYASHDQCEDYKTDVLWEKANIPCWPKMEDCSGGGEMMITNLPVQFNVGESNTEASKNRSALNGTMYQGNDPWENNEFAGRTDNGEKYCFDLAGGLGGKWCGSPFAGEDHPCAGANWWSTQVDNLNGSCLDNGIDRFGSDYRMIEMAVPDPLLCMRECLADVNCITFSFVKPGFQVSNARCYLKNAEPAPYANECCSSGYRSRCLESNPFYQ
jgi:hypothetical protein